MGSQTCTFCDEVVRMHSFRPFEAGQIVATAICIDISARLDHTRRRLLKCITAGIRATLIDEGVRAACPPSRGAPATRAAVFAPFCRAGRPSCVAKFGMFCTSESPLAGSILPSMSIVIRPVAMALRADLPPTLLRSASCCRGTPILKETIFNQ